ncbi:MAG: lysophospholipid acyltransferase family protein [Elusimicrobiota bacterium]
MSPLLSVPLRIILFFFGLLAAALPRGAELFLGRRLGRLAFALGLFRRRIVLENLRNGYPELDAGARTELARRNYEHYGLLLFEYMHFFSPAKGHYRSYMARHSVVEGFAHWERARDKGKGVIFVAAHVGYWEMLAAAGALAGIPLTIVTTILKPAWLHKLFTEQRLSTGVRPALHPGSMSTVLRALRKKEAVAFMNDQYAGAPMGVPVRFFGVKVATLAAIGPLAKRTGAAVIPAYTYRDPKGISHIVIEPELDFGPALESTEAATQVLASRVEQWVRRHPEQWLWIHRRFKHVDWSDRRDG